MSALVAEMTKEELIETIEAVIERKLLELFTDFDDEGVLKQAVYDRLLRQKQAVDNGERGLPFDVVIQQLGLG